MDRIIRSNAVETSSQSNSSQMNLHLSSEMALIYGGSVASASKVLPKASTNSHVVTVTTPNTAIKNTGNWSTSLQALLHQKPSILPYLILLSSIAFFATVVAWAWTGKIEEVGHFQGKFVPIGELTKQQAQNLGVVSSLNIHRALEVVKNGQPTAEIPHQSTPLILVATIPHQEVGFLNQEDKVQIKLDAASEPNEGIIFGRVISILPDAQQNEKLGLIYRVAVALDDDYVTKNKQIIKLQVGQTAMMKVIHQSRIADILLSCSTR